ncbi:MAG: hypothetical protein KC502_20805 [Myxococcales bacterium]|nr:hypothetical protein [Myxococcales bacterium]
MRYLITITTLLLTASLLTACGSTEDSGEKRPVSYLKDGESAKDGQSDGGATTDTGIADTGKPDTGAAKDSGGFPDGFFDPPDAGGNEEDGGSEDTGPVFQGPVGKLYAHTSGELYNLDLKSKAFVKIGKFTFDKNEGKITDLAVNKYGKIFAISSDHLYECASETAKCAWLAKLPSPFNGMTFVAEGVVTDGKEALIGISDKGVWTHIDTESGKVKLKNLGSYGGGWLSSGDAFSVVGVGTFATLKGKGKTDTLAKVNAKTGKIEKLLGETGAIGLFGLAWWNGVFYGFSKTGKVYTLDTSTGKGTEVKGLTVPKDVSWWGAGVSTRANGG